MNQDHEKQTSPIKVAKFGGTSMGDVAAMKRAAKLAINTQGRLIVVSATSGTTNQLIQLKDAALSGDGNRRLEILSSLAHRHRQMALEISQSEIFLSRIDQCLTELDDLSKGILLLRDCSPKAFDYLLSFGEKLSSLLFHCLLEKEASQLQLGCIVEWLYAPEYLKTNQRFNEAVPDFQETKEACAPLLEKLKTGNTFFVTQGFIGGVTLPHYGLVPTTLGRGGSDYSASIFGFAFNASQVDIWTDVPGMFTMDPRILKHAKGIPEITFREASEMAIFGAKVLHPKTLLPATEANIPVFVGSTFLELNALSSPYEKGTVIKKEIPAPQLPLIRALAYKKNQTLLTITTPDMLDTHGFLAKLFQIFHQWEVSLDTITTSEVSVAMTMDGHHALNENLLSALKAIGDLSIENHLTLISLIGNGLPQTPGISKTLFELIPDINVRLMSLGASKHHFGFLVDDKDYVTVLERLHYTFLENHS